MIKPWYKKPLFFSVKCRFNQSIEPVKAGEEPPLPAPAEPPPDLANQVGWRCHAACVCAPNGILSFETLRFFSLVIAIAVIILHFWISYEIICMILYDLGLYCILNDLNVYNIHPNIQVDFQLSQNVRVNTQLTSRRRRLSARSRTVPPGVPRPPKSWESPARPSDINGSPQEMMLVVEHGWANMLEGSGRVT